MPRLTAHGRSRARRSRRAAVQSLCGAFALLAFDCAAAAQALVPFTIVSEAIPASLTGVPGDAARGRAIVVDRQKGLCLLCHSGPFPEQRFQGNIGPSLLGAGARWSEGELRLRLVDASRLNPASVMPPYYRVDGLQRVGRAWAGKPILDAAEIEDVVAFLATLKEQP